MLKLVQHLIKSRPNSLSLGKSWEVALVSLVPQGFKIPLQSKDTALFQRDWDSCWPIWIVQSNSVERHCPVPKGLRQLAEQLYQVVNKSKDTALFQRDWDNCTYNGWPSGCSSKDTALFQRDWDNWSFEDHYSRCCRKTLPCSKGIETFLLLREQIDLLSKDTALFQRDWDLAITQDFKPCAVERHCPVPKGLRRIKSRNTLHSPISRKTLPCSKGIETTIHLPFPSMNESVERHCPVPKGLRHRH